MITKLVNGKIIVHDSIISGYSLYVEDEKILGIFNDNAPASPKADAEIDAKGKFISPGFVDIHTHGAGGSDFLDCEVEGYLIAAKTHAEHGTTSLCPTTTSGEYSELLSTFDSYREAKKKNDCGADFLGLHLEGPYFAMSQKGAQDEKYVRDFDKEEYLDILEKGKGDIVRWSAAPELPGAVEFAETLSAVGVLPSIGHTDASEDDVSEAFEAGFTHVTHLYSCTSGVHRKNAKRYAGVIEMAYLLDGMTVEIIADGIHLPATLLKLIYKIKGADNIALVTDSMRGAGMPEGMSILGSKKNGLEVVIEDGVAKMPDRTCFAGSVATMDRLVRNMINLAGVSLTDAVKMATETPAKIIGAYSKGVLERGMDADVIMFDENINVSFTMVKGRVIFSE